MSALPEGPRRRPAPWTRRVNRVTSHCSDLSGHHRGDLPQPTARNERRSARCLRATSILREARLLPFQHGAERCRRAGGNALGVRHIATSRLRQHRHRRTDACWRARRPGQDPPAVRRCWSESRQPAGYPADGRSRPLATSAHAGLPAWCCLPAPRGRHGGSMSLAGASTASTTAPGSCRRALKRCSAALRPEHVRLEHGSRSGRR